MLTLTVVDVAVGILWWTTLAAALTPIVTRVGTRRITIFASTALGVVAIGLLMFTAAEHFGHTGVRGLQVPVSRCGHLATRFQQPSQQEHRPWFFVDGLRIEPLGFVEVATLLGLPTAPTTAPSDCGTPPRPGPAVL